MAERSEGYMLIGVRDICVHVAGPPPPPVMVLGCTGPARPPCGAVWSGADVPTPVQLTCPMLTRAPPVVWCGGICPPLLNLPRSCLSFFRPPPPPPVVWCGV